MKKLLVVTALLSTLTQVYANGSLGRGAWVCMSEGIKDYPTIARGRTKTEASHYSQQACADYEGSEFHCDIEKCVKDDNSSNSNISIDFVIERSGGHVSINLSNGQAGYICTAEAFSKSYIAEGPTKLEAETLARQTCVADGYHGMHCDIEECEAIEGSNSGNGNLSIDIGGGIRFGRGGFSFGN